MVDAGTVAPSFPTSRDASTSAEPYVKREGHSASTIPLRTRWAGSTIEAAPVAAATAGCDRATKKIKQTTPEHLPWRTRRCAQQGHALMSGRNDVAVYVTCVDCRVHSTWRKNDLKFENEVEGYPEVTRKRLQELWAALHA